MSVFDIVFPKSSLILCDLLVVVIISTNLCSTSGLDQNILLESWLNSTGWSYDELIQKCTEKCAKEDQFYGNVKLRGCKSYADLCAQGCNKWYASINSSCKEVCQSAVWNNGISPCDVVCMSGCNVAGNIILGEVSNNTDFQTPLDIESHYDNGTSLTLKWPIEKGNYQTQTLLIQWRYEDKTNKWAYSNDFQWFENLTCIVGNLQPFTKYRFRVVMVVNGSDRKFLFSSESNVVQTIASGLPSSPPTITEVITMGQSALAVFWTSGQHTNGPLEGYKVRMTSSGNEESFFREMDITAINNYVILPHLEYETDYIISVSMMNSFGEGPTDTAVGTTSAPPEEIFNPSYIIVSDFTVTLLNVSSDGSMAKELYKSDHRLVSFDIDVKGKVFFVSDVSGHIYRIQMYKEYERDAIWSKKNLNLRPSEISVDWLNAQLYVVGEVKDEMRIKSWIIARTGFTGGDFNALKEDLTEKPLKLQIDPVNGYLFWITSESGIFRLDLDDFNSLQIYNESNLRTFSIDPETFLITTFLDSIEAEVIRISYDGKYTFREKVNNASENVMDMISLDLTLFWTDGEHIFTNDSIVVLNEACYIFKLFQPSTQVVPSSKKSPRNLQALLTSEKAELKWDSPEREYFQGSKAWSSWSYDLEVKEGDVNLAIRNIKSTFFTVEKLKPDTEYWFKVRATNDDGPKGPWGEWFQSSTWKSSENRFFLWATEKGLLRSNEIGQELENVLNGTVKGISWTDSNQFVVIGSELLQWNASHLQTIVNETSVSEMAFDWKGQMLYFVDSDKDVLTRSSLDGKQLELLPIFGVRHITLDTKHGHVYYSTGVSIEACLLHGQSCITYYSMSLLSDEELLGPALDFDRDLVLWITQSDHDAYLFSSPLAHKHHTSERLSMVPLNGPSADGWFTYISSHIIYPTSTGTVIIANNQSQHGAAINLETVVNQLQVVEDSEDYLAIYPFVAPDAVDNQTIKINGVWNNFSITWSPVRSSDDYNISYTIQFGDDVYLVSSKPSVFYPNPDLQPYSPLEIRIAAIAPWMNGPTIQVNTFSPTAAPLPPERLRAFINRIHNPLQGGQNISAIVRWDPPKEFNGPIIFYTVTCQKDEEIVLQNSTDLEAIFWGLEEGSSYIFTVNAFTLGGGGKTSEQFEITVHALYQSIPRVLIAKENIIGILDMDLNLTQVLMMSESPPTHIVAIREENRVFWATKNKTLISLHREVSQILTYLETDVDALTIDWISRTLYWSQDNKDGGSSVRFIDFNHFEEEPLESQLLFTNPKRISNVVMLPFSRTMLFLQEDGVLNEWSLKESEAGELSHGLNITYKSLYSAAFDQDFESVILVDEDDNTCILSMQAETCQIQKLNTESRNIRLAWDNGYMYALKNNSIRAYNRRKLSLEYLVNTDDITDFISLALQPYPEQKCLLPDFNSQPFVDPQTLIPELVNATRESIELQFPNITVPIDCDFRIPGLTYKLFLKEANKEDGQVFYFINFDTRQNITGLKPFTKYTVQLEVSNYYMTKLGIAGALGVGKNFTTAPGTPSHPRNISARAISPRDGLIEWLQPEVLGNDKVWYEIYWQTENPISGVVHRHQKLSPESNDNWISLFISNLRPNHTYVTWMTVFSTESDFTTTSTYNFTTFPEPEGLVFVNSTAYNLTLHWTQTPNITSAFLTYSPVDVDDAVSINITGGQTNFRLVETLEPKTKYIFHLTLFYSNPVYPYVWPPDNRFAFETLGDRPTAPGQPLVEHIKGEIFKVFWKPARNNGAPVEEYSLEALQSSQAKRVRRSQYFAQDSDHPVVNKTLARLGLLPWADEIEPIQDMWIPYYNGTDTYCVVTQLHTMKLFMFRVRARNSYGWGPYSIDSEMIAEPLVLPRKRDTLVLAILAPIVIVSTCVTMIVLIRFIHSRRRHAKKIFYESRPSIWGLDVTTLQQVSRSRNFSQTSSILHTGKPLTDGDIALLPQISRGQISVQRFLGSGAFGEVYEGLITYPEDNSQDCVAIKMLRKGASDQEKTELLQEAHLMSQFKHENIVKLIGVCFDLDSISIVMELMEGGDLQSYLRQSRPSFSKPETLSLSNLIRMCLDVCTGCRYLEDLHFLHRDLACRNCLVSSLDPDHRVVKIGDFGLARDIYKNDYYRKEGEGLLPVRWMAPECLVDGVFTSQSDVWSFGILLWEILSLGQQPYPAQSNLDVLNFVKEGGRLQKPDGCPTKLYNIMLQCWSFDPEHRPTFQQCLDGLLTLKDEAMNNVLDDREEVNEITKSEDKAQQALVGSVASLERETTNLENHSHQGVGQSSPSGDNSQELSLLKAPTSIDGIGNGHQKTMKSVHYVNEGRSRL